MKAIHLQIGHNLFWIIKASQSLIVGCRHLGCVKSAIMIFEINLWKLSLSAYLTIILLCCLDAGKTSLNINWILFGLGIIICSILFFDKILSQNNGIYVSFVYLILLVVHLYICKTCYWLCICVLCRCVFVYLLNLLLVAKFYICVFVKPAICCVCIFLCVKPAYLCICQTCYWLCRCRLLEVMPRFSLAATALFWGAITFICLSFSSYFFCNHFYFSYLSL